MLVAPLHARDTFVRVSRPVGTLIACEGLADATLAWRYRKLAAHPAY